MSGSHTVQRQRPVFHWCKPTQVTTQAAERTGALVGTTSHSQTRHAQEGGRRRRGPRRRVAPITVCGAFRCTAQPSTRRLGLAHPAAPLYVHAPGPLRGSLEPPRPARCSTCRRQRLGLDGRRRRGGGRARRGCRARAPRAGVDGRAWRRLPNTAAHHAASPGHATPRLAPPVTIRC